MHKARMIGPSAGATEYNGPIYWPLISDAVGQAGNSGVFNLKDAQDKLQQHPEIREMLKNKARDICDLHELGAENEKSIESALMYVALNTIIRTS